MASWMSAGIKAFVVPSVGRCNWLTVLRLAERHVCVHPSLGIHPYYAAEHVGADVEVLAELVSQHKSQICAMGEMGLDRTRPDLQGQRQLLELQLAVARDQGLPVILHSVKTHSDVLALLKKKGVEKGVVHAFTGSEQDALSFVRRGLKIGVGVVLAWPRATKTRDAIARLPLDSLVLETDSPDMPLPGEAKGDGTPLGLLRVFDELCRLRPEPPDIIADQLLINARELFNLSF